MLRNPFTDVKEGQWFAESALWAASTGVVAGYPDGRFGPHDEINREQFASILYRYQKNAGLAPLDVLMDREYSDWDDISLYAKSAVNKMTMQGIFMDWPPDPEGNFNPKALMTRAEVATAFYRWVESVSK